MNGKKLLAPDRDIDISDVEIDESRVSILQSTQSASMVSMLRENVEKRKRALSVLIDDNRAASSQRIVEALERLDGILLDEEVLEAVKQGIITSKDPARSYNEFVKAASELSNRAAKQNLTSSNPEAAQNAMSGKSIKIAISDASGTTMVDFSGGDV